MELTPGQISLLKHVAGKEEVNINDFYDIVNNLVEEVHEFQRQKYGTDGVEDAKILLSKMQDKVLKAIKDGGFLNEDKDWDKVFEDFKKPKPKKPPIKYIYKNWKGEIAVRTIIPLDITYGTNEYYTTPTYLLRAFDIDKEAVRIFDMNELFPYKDKSKLIQHIGKKVIDDLRKTK